MNKILLSLSLFAFSSFSTNSIADVGEDAYNKSCAACHGAKGGKPILPSYPKLQGQNAEYTLKQLQDYKSGKRKDPTMSVMVNLIAGKEEAVAEYLSKQ